MIKVENLTYCYPHFLKAAVSGASFEIEKGEIFGFLGPSGAGKSTVQNILTGLLTIQEGEIFFDRTSIRRIKRSFYEEIGVSFEFPNLYDKLTGYENLFYYGNMFSKKTLDPVALLDAVGLGDARNKKAKDYSKGMKQRLVFARSLINNPSILFLDEPLSGLDPSTAQGIKEIIKSKKKEGATIFLTTHNMFVAEELCDRVAFINEGKILLMDTPKNLKLLFGDHSVKIEYAEGEQILEKIFFFNKDEDKEKLSDLLKNKKIVTIHSQEATLEQVFINLTGRGLS